MSNTGRRLRRSAAGLVRLATGWRGSHRRAHAGRLDHWPHEDRWPNRLRSCEQDPGGLQGHAVVGLGQNDKSSVPPVNASWSVTPYDAEGFQVANNLNRFGASSWMPFKHGPDGSLDLDVQNASPGVDKEANWLPAPKGPFNLTMRLYTPKSDALTGRWNPPPVMKDARSASLPAQ
jgi:hypothetical protein